MFEKCKKSLIISSIILLLFLSIGSISASEDISDDSVKTAEIDTNDINAAENTIKNTKTDNSEVNAADEEKSSLKSSNEQDLKETSTDHIRANTETVSSSASKDSSSNKVLSNSESSSSNSSGENSNQRIIKSTKAEYSAMTQQYTTGKISYPVKLYNIVDYNGVEYKEAKYNSVVKLRVYTGKSFKNYYGTTDNNGVALIQISNLALGKHTVKIYAGDALKGSSSIKITKSSTKVYAPAQTVKHEKSNYYKIKVVDSHGNLVKKVTLKLKVYTGKKSKTYTIKTNKNGVAKYQTKSLKLGTHKITIKSNSKKYKISKTSKIIVKKLLAPTLKTLNYYPNGNDYSTKLTWSSKKGNYYQVIRKSNDNYEVISTVQAKSESTSFYDKVNKGAIYTYSVREVIKNSNNNIIGPYDEEGLKLIDSPNVSVDFQNLKATITWQAMENATNYRIFRKINSNSEYKCIAVVNANQLSYVDTYYKSASELSSILNSEVFADPSFNSLHYTVRACSVKEVDSTTKISYGLYLKDGDFNLEAPSIVSLKDNTISWGKVPNAEGYLILKKTNSSTVWTEIGHAVAKSSTVNSLHIGTIDNTAYYAVQAYATKNGVRVYSNYDKGFSLKDYSKNNSQYRILYFGDSITYGSPYKSESSRHIFSMPYRIAQLTGCVYYNPSIPGSTYHDLGTKADGKNVENTNYYRYRICREVVDQIADGKLPGNWEDLDTAKNSEGKTNTNISEYNIVFLSAGTNDYLDNTIIGEEDSTDVSTFNGALNHILGKIQNASQERMARGLDKIKVVFVDLFYSDRTYNEKEIHNRDTTKNQIGNYLVDYQNALTTQLEKWTTLAAETLTFYNFKTRDYDIVNSENCPYTASDNLHYTKFTYGQYGNAIAQFLVDNVF